MKREPLVSFYRGWLIEVRPCEAGFYPICYSPHHTQFSLVTAYPVPQSAIIAARRQINRYGAGYSLSLWLQEQYEADRVSFEDWRLLQQSLTEAVSLQPR